MNFPLESARLVLESIYRDRLNTSFGQFSDHYDAAVPAWIWSSLELKTPTNEAKDNALLLDPDIGLAAYFLRFSLDLPIRQQVAHALRIRSALVPTSVDESVLTDSFGSWRVALHWYIDKEDFPEWLDQASEIRAETAHFEEVSIDSIVFDGKEWESTFINYAFPRLLLRTREVLAKPSKNDVDDWGNADHLVKELVKSFPLKFSSGFEQAFAEDVRSNLSRLLDEQENPGTTDDEVYGPARRLESLEVRSFRNIKKMTLDFPGAVGSSVIQGPNGSGKSSIFEALSFALCGSSYRFEQFLEDKNLDRQSSSIYTQMYLSPIGSNSEPKITLNGQTTNSWDKSIASGQFASAKIMGTLLSQDQSSGLLQMGRKELGAQILGSASQLSAQIQEYIERRYTEARQRQQEFLDRWVLNKNIKNTRTARLRIAEQLLSISLPEPTAQLGWLERDIALRDQRMSGSIRMLIDKWRSEKSILEELAAELSKELLSRQDTEELLKQAYEQRLQLVEETNHLLKTVREVIAKWPANLSTDVRLWGEWLKSRNTPGKPDSSGVAKLLGMQREVQDQLQRAIQRGDRARAHESTLNAVRRFIGENMWVEQNGEVCPVCRTDFADEEGIKKEIDDFFAFTQVHIESIKNEYRSLTLQAKEMQKRLVELGESPEPIDSDAQEKVLSALGSIAGAESGNIVDALKDDDEREGLLQIVTFLRQVPVGLSMISDLGQDEVLSEMAVTLVDAFATVEIASAEENAWRVIRNEMTSDLAKVVKDHLPETIQAVWAELALNLTPFSPQLPGNFVFGLDTKGNDPEATFSIDAHDGENRLAQYVLNSAEVRTLGLAWFYLRYIVSGRFNNAFLVLDDPAQEMDQPTFRELCRFWETFLRLHRRLNKPLQLVILLHMDERALDAARATNGTIHFLKWNRGKSVLLKSTRVYGESIQAPSPSIILSSGDA